jgi:ABC-type transport system involved in multi-copper enzyme maturation permease subunit
MFRFTVSETLRKGTLMFCFAIGTIVLLIFTLGLSRSPVDYNVVTMFGIPFSTTSTMNFDLVDFLFVALLQISLLPILLLVTFGVSGLVPDMLEKGTIELFLSKPLTRTELFIARSLGASSGITLNLIYFFLGMWIIFGLKLGTWHSSVLLFILLFTLTYYCFYSIVAVIGLITRSTALTVMLSIVFVIISGGLEVRVNGMYLLWDNVFYHRILDALYYLTPQLSAMIDNSTKIITKIQTTPGATEFTITPFIYSFFSTTLLYLLSIWYFYRRDY